VLSVAQMADVVTGAIIILAVYADMMRRKGQLTQQTKTPACEEQARSVRRNHMLSSLTIGAFGACSALRRLP
jgi:hypothetical protein